MELNEDQLKQFQKVFEKDYVLFSENGHTTELYILVSGRVGVYKSNSKITDIVEKGTFIGEMSTLLNEPRSATIKTLEKSVFIVIPGEKLKDIIKISPAIGYKLAVILAKRVKETTKNKTIADGHYRACQNEFIKFYNEVIQTYNTNPNPYLQNLLQKMQNNRYLYSQQ